MSASEPRRAGRRVTHLALAACAVALVCWVVAAVLMAGRGLDTSDEGFYLLSYRWWDSTPRVFTGVQYIYGPAMDALGGSVVGLRMVRLVSVLALHATLGWAVVTWLRVRAAERLLSPVGELLAVAAITVAGGVEYGWLPLSPGYNDVAVLTSLGLAAALLRSMRAARLGNPLPVLPAVGAGLAATLLFVAKWSSALLVLGVVVILGVLALRRVHATGWLRFTAAAVVTFIVAGTGFTILAGGPSSLVTIVDVNRLVAESSNSPSELLKMYLRTGVEILGYALLLATPAAALVLLARAFGSRGRQRESTWLLGAAPLAVMLFAWPGRGGVPIAGTENVERYAAALIALAFVVLACVLVEHSRRLPPRAEHAPDALAMLLLILLPVIQALGTGNALYVVAVNGFACWIAVMLTVVAEIEGVARPVGRATVVVAVTVCASVGVSGLVEAPYRTSSFADSTVRVGGRSIVAGLKVGPVQARLMHHVRVAAGNPPEGTPILAFDELAGYVLALDGRSVGEAWYSAIDHHRTHVGIAEACAQSGALVQRRPVVIFGRKPEPGDLAAMMKCGIDLNVGYQLIQVPFGAGRSVLVYRPTATGE